MDRWGRRFLSASFALVATAGLCSAQLRADAPISAQLSSQLSRIAPGSALPQVGPAELREALDRQFRAGAAPLEAVAAQAILVQSLLDADVLSDVQRKLDLTEDGRKTAERLRRLAGAQDGGTQANGELNRYAERLSRILASGLSSGDPAAEWDRLFDALAPFGKGGAEVSLQDILDVAASPSSKRIAGWRKKAFDEDKRKATSLMEADPSIPLRRLRVRLAAEIGPSLNKIPPLVPAMARIGARYVKGKSDIRRIDRLPRDVQDYVIIGAGMAGVSAGAVIADANLAGASLKGLLLEGGSLLAGRARDVEIRGLKVGLGPSWLSGRYNMLRRMADLLGLTRERTFFGKDVFLDGRRLSEREKEGLFKEEDAAEAEMIKAGDKALRGGGRVPSASAETYFPPSPWREVAEDEVGPGDAGADIGQIDIIDLSRFQTNQDDFVKEGIQEFVTRIAQAAELPVAFNSQVTRAIRGKDGVWTLTLRDGRRVRTRQVIYAGSIGALAGIDFGSDLPRAKADAARVMPMGNFTKFLFTTSEPLGPGTSRNSWVVDAETDRKTGQILADVQFVVKYLGDPRVNIMFAGGKNADMILALSEGERVAYIEKKFAKVAGRPVRVEIAGVTPFGSDPLFRGSYANVLPGNEGVHTAYAAPVRGLNFAGDAAGSAQNSESLLGAFISGIDSAYDVIAALLLDAKRP